MSWEPRTKNKKYFFTKHRVNGKLVREYYGRGPVAELFARADRRAAETLSAERAQFARLESALDHQEQLLRLLIDAHLILAGYYNHKGQWRKHRARIF